MNIFISPTFVTKDTAVNWMNHIKLVAQFDRTYDRAWENNPMGAKIGDTAHVRTPQRFIVNEGQAFQQQAILNQTVPISVNHQFQVGMGWSSSDSALSVEEVQDRYTKPAGKAMANKADVIAGLEVYKSVYWGIGAPGVAITGTTAQQTYTDGIAKLRAVGVPEDLVAVLDPVAQGKLVGSVYGQFNPQAKISRDYSNGVFSGPAFGVDEWAWDPNIPTHTTGTFTSSTPLVNGANQTGSSLITDGWGTYTFKEGDSFTIVGVNAVNPVSYVDTGLLQQFTVTATLAGSSTATISITPPIITSGQLQTVTASPANDAVITYLGATAVTTGTLAATASRQSLIFHPGAFAFVAVDLPANLPGANAKRVNDAEAKISLRWAEQWSLQTDQLPSRCDLLCGVAAIMPSMALRVWS